MNGLAPTFSASGSNAISTERGVEQRIKNQGEINAEPGVMQPTKTQPSVLVKLAFLQVISTITFALGMYYCFDAREALSAVFGGGVAIIGSLYSAGRLFTTKQDADAAEILMRFYVSVVLKIIITLVMMSVCLIIIKVSVLSFIVAYLIAAVIVNLLVLLIPARL